MAQAVGFYYPWLAECLKAGLLGTGSADFFTTANVGHYVMDADYAFDPTGSDLAALTTAERVFTANYNSTVDVGSGGVLSMTTAENLALSAHQGNTDAYDSIVGVTRHNDASITTKWRPAYYHRGSRRKAVLAAEVHKLAASTLPWHSLMATKPAGVNIYDIFWRHCLLAGLQGTSLTEFDSSHASKVRCLLLNDSYTFNPDDEVLADIPSSVRVTPSSRYGLLDNITVTASASGIVIDSDDPYNWISVARADATGSWWQNGSGGAWDDITEGSGPATQLLVYLGVKTTGFATMLVGCFPLTSPLVETISGGAYNSQWNVTWPAAGFLTLANRG